MLNTKEKSKQMFSWISSLWTDADDDYCAKEIRGNTTYLSSIWLWDLGTKEGDLPFKKHPYNNQRYF